MELLESFKGLNMGIQRGILYVLIIQDILQMPK